MSKEGVSEVKWDPYNRAKIDVTNVLYDKKNTMSNPLEIDYELPVGWSFSLLSFLRVADRESKNKGLFFLFFEEFVALSQNEMYHEWVSRWGLLVLYCTFFLVLVHV